MGLFKSQPRQVTSLINEETVKLVRQRCIGSPLSCAQFVNQDMIWDRRHACMVVYNGAGGFIAVPNDFSGGPQCYEYHAVVLVGDEVIDLLHSDRLFTVKGWIKRMKRLTPNLQIDFQRSSPLIQQMILNKLI